MQMLGLKWLGSILAVAFLALATPLALQEAAEQAQSESYQVTQFVGEVKKNVGQLEFQDTGFIFTGSKEPVVSKWNYSDIKRIELSSRQLSFQSGQGKTIKFVTVGTQSFRPSLADLLRLKAGRVFKSKIKEG